MENPLHLAIILIVLLLVFGAKRLPEMGRSLGHGLRGFRESISGEDPAPSIVREPRIAGPRASASEPTAAADVPEREDAPLAA